MMYLLGLGKEGAAMIRIFIAIRIKISCQYAKLSAKRAELKWAELNSNHSLWSFLSYLWTFTVSWQKYFYYL